MRALYLAVVLSLALLAPATAQFSPGPDSRPHPGQALWSNKPNQYGGYQFASSPPICNGACTGTAYTVDESWCGRMAQFTSSSTITVTLPSTIRFGCNIDMEQDGSGKVTPSAGSGATLHNKGSFTGTSGQYAVITVGVWSNSNGQSAEWILAGDGS